MKFSVVIPTFNEQDMIHTCLTALAAQTRPADEILVVDNNCTDRTVERAQAFAGVRIVSEKRQGIFFARNAGFDAARGDIILRIDADTRVPSTWIAQMEQVIKQKSADAYTGPCTFYDKPFKQFGSYVHRFFFFGLSYLLQGHHTLWGSNMAITKDMWTRVAPTLCQEGDVQYHEDVDLALHIHQLGGIIVYDRRLLAAVSGRRMSDSPANLIRYVGRWLHNIRTHAWSRRTQS